jgi:hypothetical protein
MSTYCYLVLAAILALAVSTEDAQAQNNEGTEKQEARDKTNFINDLDSKASPRVDKNPVSPKAPIRSSTFKPVPFTPIEPIQGFNNSLLKNSDQFFGSQNGGNQQNSGNQQSWGNQQNNNRGWTRPDWMNADGTGRRPDGTEISLDSNGNKVYKLPNGGTWSQRADGSRVSTSPDGSTTVTKADGSKEFTTASGQRSVLNADGTGTKPDGTTITKDYDGSLISKYANGTSWQRKADGTEIYTNQQGEKRIKKPNGQKVLVKPDGTESPMN